MDGIIDVLTERWYTDCLVYDIPLSPSDVRDIVEELVLLKEEKEEWMKEEIEEVKEMKKYTIDDYKEFCNDVLVLPPLDDFYDGNIDETEWYESHKIHITVGNHDMELEHYADNVTVIYIALKEMYEIEKQVNPDIKIFSDFDVYEHQYNYEEMKVITVLSTIDVNRELDYEDYVRIAEAVYSHWVDGRDTSEDAKYKKYPWLEFQSSNEDGYIQLYAERVLPKFIELYKEVVL